MRLILILSSALIATSAFSKRQRSMSDQWKMLKRYSRNVYTVYALFESQAQGRQPLIVRGTAFLASYKKYNFLITNAHICFNFALLKQAANGTLTVRRPPSKKLLRAKILYIETKSDICILSSPFNKRRGFKLGRTYRTMRDVYSIGYPVSSTDIIKAHVDVRKGVVIERYIHDVAIPLKQRSCLKNKLSFKGGQCFIELDGVITTIMTSAGGSGSPVFTSDGYVVGIIFGVTFNLPRAAMIPVESIRRAIRAYIKKSTY